MKTVLICLVQPDGKLNGSPHEADSQALMVGRFFHAAAEDTGLPAAAADLVSCCLVIHELPQAATRALIAEAARILRPGGALCIMVRCARPDAASCVDSCQGPSCGHAFAAPVRTFRFGRRDQDVTGCLEVAINLPWRLRRSSHA